ncbi:hypothetical protein MGA3_11575 [Bacillus methanolicus MGA3]|nr:hypothetical protein MGA3_11575 [Bacillus methanolicus MGA3]
MILSILKSIKLISLHKIYKEKVKPFKNLGKYLIDQTKISIRMGDLF